MALRDCFGYSVGDLLEAREVTRILNFREKQIPRTASRIRDDKRGIRDTYNET